MARKSTDARGVITLQCSDCRERNYATAKNRRNDTQRMELRKYCSRCRGHKTHREVRNPRVREILGLPALEPAAPAASEGKAS